MVKVLTYFNPVVNYNTIVFYIVPQSFEVVLRWTRNEEEEDERKESAEAEQRDINEKIPNAHNHFDKFN